MMEIKIDTNFKIPIKGKKYKVHDAIITISGIYEFIDNENCYFDESNSKNKKRYWVSENSNTWYNWQDGENFIEIK